MENHRFKKKYGQNFLRDESILDRIIEESNIKEDSLVIEIGPGDGALTSKLKGSCKQVLAYEIDTELKDKLECKFLNSNVTIIFDDFMNRDIKEDLKEYNYSNLYVISNIPYYITTPIIEKIIESDIEIEKIVLMVQKEVADRFSAVPGSKNYGSITVYLNYSYEVRKLFNVPRKCFYPEPNVDSAIIELIKKKNRFKVNEEIFYKLIKDSFQFKRKTIKNNLSNYDLKVIDKVLQSHNQNLNTRAEQITLETFIEIANCLDE